MGGSWSVPVVAWGVYEMWTVSGAKLSMTGALVHEVNQLVPADLLPTPGDPFHFDGVVIGNWMDVGEESRWTTVDPVFPGQVRAT